MPGKTKQKLQEPHIKICHFQCHLQVNFNDPITGNQELISSVNKLQKSSLLFLPVTLFPDFCNKIKYDINKDTKSFTELGKYLLSGFL